MTGGGLGDADERTNLVFAGLDAQFESRRKCKPSTMKIWLIIKPAPIGYDTAYLAGRIISRYSDVHVSKFTSLAELLATAPSSYDVVLNRTISADPVLLEALEAHAKSNQAYLINSADATRRACDKRTYLNDYTRFIPETWVVQTFGELQSLFARVGFELVVKDPFGKHGQDVARYAGGDCDEDIGRILEGCRKSGVVAQRFCSGFAEGDKRVILHRNRDGEYDIAACIVRVPKTGSWISNLGAGGRVQTCELTEQEADLAKSVARLSGLDYVGLDVGTHNGRSLLIETNAYTGGYMDFDTNHRNCSSGDEFARFVGEISGYSGFDQG